MKIHNDLLTDNSPRNDDNEMITAMATNLSSQKIGDSFTNEEEIKYVNPLSSENSRVKLVDSINRMNEKNKFTDVKSASSKQANSSSPFVTDIIGTNE